MAMVENPRTASHFFVCSISRKTAIHVCRKPSSVNFKPSNDLICVVAMVKAAADVNPATTGAAIKSIKKPLKNSINQTFSMQYVSKCPFG